MMKLKRITQKLMRNKSIYSEKMDILIHLFKKNAKIIIIDIGGHEGGFTELFRSSKMLKQSIIFEPLAYESRQLRKRFADSTVTIIEAAVSDKNGETTFYEYNRSSTSSLLAFNESLNASDHLNRDVAKEHIVKSVRLDDVPEVNNLKNIDLMKIDVQGAEMMVITGATRTLGKTKYLVVELSLQHVYQNAPLIPDVIAALREQGFILQRLLPAYQNNHGELVQCDGIFVNQYFCNDK